MAEVWRGWPRSEAWISRAYVDVFSRSRGFATLNTPTEPTNITLIIKVKQRNEAHIYLTKFKGLFIRKLNTICHYSLAYLSICLNFVDNNGMKN